MENAASNFAAFERCKWFLKDRGARALILNSTKPATDYKKAAVLFLMREHQCGELEVLLTKRSNTLPSHAGENCLPGGMFDAAKDRCLGDTALREAEEEVGIGRDEVRVVAELPPTPSGWTEFMAVTPVVGILKTEINLRLNDEVAEAFWVPVKFFLGNKHHSSLLGRWWNSVTASDVFDYPDPQGGMVPPLRRTIWGLTARICIAASAIAFNRHPDFPHSTTFVYDVSVAEGRVLLMQIALTREEASQCGCNTMTVYDTFTLYTNAKL